MTPLESHTGTTTLSDEPADRLELRAAAITDVGCKRSVNQDAVAVLTNEITGVSLLVLADGMGGHAGGETASAMAIEAFSRAFRERSLLDAGDMAELIICADKEINAKVPEGGTTVVAALVSTEVVNVAHIGDSRAYLIRDDRPLRMTRDHSWVEVQVERGVLSQKQARTHPRRNVLTQALGTGRQDPADTHRMRVFSGDTLLLCSDGLHGVLSDDEIADIAASDSDVTSRAEDLIEAAKKRGAPDNVTVALCEVAMRESSFVEGADNGARP